MPVGICANGRKLHSGNHNEEAGKQRAEKGRGASEEISLRGVRRAKAENSGGKSADFTAADPFCG